MLNKSQKIDMLFKMMLIREFEETVTDCKERKFIYGGTHCYNGEEAVAVGVCSALNKNDYIVSNHRPHGHAIAKGVSPKSIMAEMFGKISGTNHGKGGSMHIQDSSVGLIASTGIVGSGIPMACGLAFSAKHEGNGRVACVFFGDGSANEGVLHEALNIASVWNLPVLFVLEDNELAITVNTRESSACNDYVKLASVYGIDGCHVDGQDVESVYDKSSSAVEGMRLCSRPYFLQAHTVRFNEHAEGAFYKRMIEKRYRDYSRLEQDKACRCPIELFLQKLKSNHIVTDMDVETVREKVKQMVVESVDFAKASPEPEAWRAFTDVYKDGGETWC